LAVIHLTTELKPGMRLDQDIYNREKVLLLAKGAVLTEDNIKTLKRLGYIRVSIQKPSTSADYWNRIDEKKLNEFKKTYEESGEEVVELIKCIGDGQQVNTEKAFQVTGSILKECGSSYNLFPYMSQVKELDYHTSGHSINVSLICGAVCQWLAIEEEIKKDIVVAGLLHDIGKSRLNPDILYKSQLTIKDEEDFKKHTTLGLQILENTGAPEVVRLGALLHHEREDGSGYPRGLKGNDIPLVAKIIAMADVYDNMSFTQSRGSKPCPFKVLEKLQTEFLGVLDTRVLTTFLARTAECYVGEIVRLSDGRTGQVVVINRLFPSRPMVRSNDQIIDLSLNPEIQIESILPVSGGL